MKSYRKKQVGGSLLRFLPTSAMVPTRLEDLYYGILFGLGMKDLPMAKQLLATRIAWTFCRIRDVQDRRYLFGLDASDFAERGEAIRGLADAGEKAKELELLPQLDKSLIALITAFYSDKDKATNKKGQEQSALDAILNDIDNIDNANGENREATPA